MKDLRNIDFSKELTFKTSKSGGPGGQNVNKVETKVELVFDLPNAHYFTEEEKEKISKKLKSRIYSDACIHVTSSKYRSQWRNKKACQEKFIELLEEALKKEIKRKPTKISRGQNEHRLKKKKRSR